MDLLQEKEINGKSVWFGFSLGGYALMELATKINFDKIVLVSPTPLFLETINDIGDDYVKAENGDKSIREMCSMINCPVEVYVGEKEKDLMRETAYDIADLLNVDLNVVEGIGHDDRLFARVIRREKLKIE